MGTPRENPPAISDPFPAGESWEVISLEIEPRSPWCGAEWLDRESNRGVRECESSESYVCEWHGAPNKCDKTSTDHQPRFLSIENQARVASPETRKPARRHVLPVRGHQTFVTLGYSLVGLQPNRETRGQAGSFPVSLSVDLYGSRPGVWFLSVPSSEGTTHLPPGLTGFAQVPYGAADWRVFSVICRVLFPYIPAPLHTILASPSKYSQNLDVKRLVSVFQLQRRDVLNLPNWRMKATRARKGRQSGWHSPNEGPEYLLVPTNTQRQLQGLLLASHQGDPRSIPGRVTPDLRMWKSCRTMSLVGGSSRGSPVSPALSFRRCSILASITLVGSQDLNTREVLLGEEQRSCWCRLGRNEGKMERQRNACGLWDGEEEGGGVPEKTCTERKSKEMNGCYASTDPGWNHCTCGAEHSCRRREGKAVGASSEGGRRSGRRARQRHVDGRRPECALKAVAVMGNPGLPLLPAARRPATLLIDRHTETRDLDPCRTPRHSSAVTRGAVCRVNCTDPSCAVALRGGARHATDSRTLHSEPSSDHSFLLRPVVGRQDEGIARAPVNRVGASARIPRPRGMLGAGHPAGVNCLVDCGVATGRGPPPNDGGLCRGLTKDSRTTTNTAETTPKIHFQNNHELIFPEQSRLKCTRTTTNTIFGNNHEQPLRNNHEPSWRPVVG
ncbi:hypothetical protein PR048_016676 [Dryococelus australis]|uniref:Uncharacterized protein n=1 Tax=Dryococelus australis TaxID=614101 RepID=A0ABQ9H7L7_9NEOP|nr:hypothetical protein PR048_016676 [Dryococelus australis]